MATISEAMSIAVDYYQAGRLSEAMTLCRRVLEQAPDEAAARHLLAVAMAQSGAPSHAAGMFRDAVALAPANPDPYRNMAALLEALRNDAAAAFPRLAVARLRPDDSDAVLTALKTLTTLADAALDRGDPAAAVPLYQKARRLFPQSFEICFNLAVAERDAGQLAAAIDSFTATTRLRPDFARAYFERGLLEKRLDRRQAAPRSFRQALCLNPADADFLFVLGASIDPAVQAETALRVLRWAGQADPAHDGAHATAAIILQSTGRHGAAVACYRRALALRPALPEALTNLCIALTEQGALHEAARQGERAVKLTPENAPALLALANAFKAARAMTGAVGLFRLLVERHPDFVEAFGNLGAALSSSGRSAEAEAPTRRAVALSPGVRTYYANMGLILTDMGRVTEGLAAYRRALLIDPGWAETHSDMIFAMDVLPEVTTADLQAARRAFNQQHAVPLRAMRKSPRNDPAPDRRLRIGHVTADFRMNSAAFAFGPILEEMDRSQFEIYCYSGVVVEDDITRRFRAMADQWRNILGMSDEALAELIRADGVDILVDMSGHSSGNRLRMFALRPAPVQLTAWTHPHGIGLETMDYVFSDPVTIPVEERGLFMEEIWDLPLCIPFRPPNEAPPLAPPPAIETGRVTFGCLNRLSKVTGRVIATWARLLRARPNADLLLKDKALNDPAERSRLAMKFSELGVAPDRLRFLGGTSQAEHIAVYNSVDITLDPYPLNGGITTMESLWMGVPVVALMGQAPASRVSAAILSSLGLSDWVGRSEDQYVDIAAAMADDLAELETLRRGMRGRFLASPAGDITLYTRAVENAYREMWRRWARQQEK